MTARQLAILHREIISCRACPRLVAWREAIATTKRKAYREDDYWGRPIPGFGDPSASLIVVGLAPAAHGGNRTGRIFTGDRSGDFLFAALHRAGFANQPTSTHRDDGLALRGVFILSPVRCAPPDNKPKTDEIERCSPLFDRELALLPNARVFFLLGAIAWKSTLDHLVRIGRARPSSRPKFGHGARAVVGDRTLVGSYHVSQQNTQTGRLTPKMFDEALAVAAALAERRAVS